MKRWRSGQRIANQEQPRELTKTQTSFWRTKQFDDLPLREHTRSLEIRNKRKRKYIPPSGSSTGCAQIVEGQLISRRISRSLYARSKPDKGSGLQTIRSYAMFWLPSQSVYASMRAHESLECICHGKRYLNHLTTTVDSIAMLLCHYSNAP